jgi:hypothetical protein
MREMRATRLSAVQRLAQVTEDVRRWISEHLRVAQAAAAAEKIERAESAKEVEKIAPTVKALEMPAQNPRRRIVQNRQQPQHGHSHGIRM